MKNESSEKKRYINNILLVVGRVQVSQVIEAATHNFFLLAPFELLCSRKRKERYVGQVNKLRHNNDNAERNL